MRRTVLGVLATIAVATWIAQDAQAATFNAACSVPALKQAILDANAAAGPDSIELAGGCTYTFTAADNSDAFDGANALPIVTGPLSIVGHDAIFERANGSPAFRFIQSSADLYIEEVTFIGGLAESSDTARGGAIFAQAGFTGDRTEFENNIASSDFAYGGALFVSGNLTITDGFFLENEVQATFGFAQGGGLRSFGTTVLTRTDFESNVATSETGSALGGGVDSAASVTMQGSSFDGNSTSGTGGGGGAVSSGSGIEAVDSEFTLNTVTASAGTGTGGAVRGDGFVTITNSSFITNSVSAESDARGGGSYSFGGMEITRSLFQGNSTTSTSSRAEGGGAYVVQTLDVENSTFSGNSTSGVMATFTSAGGGTFSILATTISHSTYFNNSVTGFNARGHAVGLVNGSTITSSILVGSATPQCWAEDPGDIAAGADTLVSDGSCDNADVVAVANIGLAALAANGGFTKTHALQENSPALGRGESCPFTDQRGFLRPVTGCDSGAFEDAGVVPPQISPYDVDCNDVVDAVDVIAVLNQLAGIATGPQPAAPCDANVDDIGGVTLLDAMLIRRFLAGLVPT